jgi:Phosphoadenosine phosphosulfate reductase family
VGEQSHCDVSIHIVREAAAEFRNPVMRYSIGKESSVMLHLAVKAFFPAKPHAGLPSIDRRYRIERDNYLGTGKARHPYGVARRGDALKN